MRPDDTAALKESKMEWTKVFTAEMRTKGGTAPARIESDKTSIHTHQTSTMSASERTSICVCVLKRENDETLNSVISKEGIANFSRSLNNKMAAEPHGVIEEFYKNNSGSSYQ